MHKKLTIITEDDDMPSPFEINTSIPPKYEQKYLIPLEICRNYLKVQDDQISKTNLYKVVLKDLAHDIASYKGQDESVIAQSKRYKIEHYPKSSKRVHQQ